MSAIAIFFAVSPHVSYYLLFKINQNYIAKNLCVQKDIPENTCQGCCQLQEVMNDTDEDDSQSNIFVVPEISILGIIPDVDLDLVPNTLLSKIQIKHKFFIIQNFLQTDTPPPEMI